MVVSAPPPARLRPVDHSPFILDRTYQIASDLNEKTKTAQKN